MESPIKIGVSSCLLGNKVRYNGGHAHDRFITGTLGEYVEFVPVCPEVECGLGTPRLTMHLKGDVVNTRLVNTKTGEDHTERMVKWAKKIGRTCQGGPLWMKSMVARHTNMMIHMLGYFKKDLTGDEK